MDLGIRDRVAMVAASSRGLGLASALALAGEGCRVSICGRDEGALGLALAALESAAPGGRFLATPCDLTRAEALGAWHEATCRALGAVDILVTNTGGPPAAEFMALSEEQWASGVQSTLMNVVRLSRLVLPGMRARKWGRLVHITSLVAKQPLPLLTISSTLRAGLSGLTKTLALEFARDGVTVNALLPGHVLTDRQLELAEVRAQRQGIPREEALAQGEAGIPMGRFGLPREIGEVVAFLCSERASYLTGVSLQVDGAAISGTF